MSGLSTYSRLLESYGARLTALEVAASTQREDIARRLLRIEDKIDRLGGK